MVDKTAIFTHPITFETKAETKYPKVRKLKDIVIGCHFHLAGDISVLYRKRAGGRCQIYRKLSDPYQGGFGLAAISEDQLVQEVNPVPFIIEHYHPVWGEMLQHAD